VNSHKRIIVTDAPLLALRISQAGAHGVVVADCPEVLRTMKKWISERDIFVCATKNTRAREIKSAIGRDIPTLSACGNLSPEVRKALGLPEAPPKERQAITPLLLRDLTEYAKAHLASGTECLKALGADDADFIRAFNIGYLPGGFQSALNAESRDALHGHRIAKAVMIPAFDESGAG
jgi:hypothetical protein